MDDVRSSTHECPKDREPRTYLALFVDEWNENVIMQRKGNVLKFVRIECPELPHRGSLMSECFSERFAEMSGTKYELVFLYSTINDILLVEQGTPYCAIFECISPIDVKTRKLIHPASSEYEWVDMEELSSDQTYADHEEACDSVAFYSALRPHYEECEEDGLRPWQVPGWHTRTLPEIISALSAKGYRATSSIEQYMITPNSAILRVETQKCRVYVKASTQREGPITDVIASFAPHVVRKPIVVIPQEGLMLMADYGKTQHRYLTVDDYELLSVSLAELQVESMKHIDELKAAGCPTESRESWISNMKEMLSDKSILRSLSEYDEFESREGIADISEYTDAVYKIIEHLFEPGRYPICLVHGDLHDQNVIKADDGTLIIFDWGSARIDFPMLDISSLEDEILSGSECRHVGMESYLKVWEKHISPSVLKPIRVLVSIQEKFRWFWDLFKYCKRIKVYPRLKFHNHDEIYGLKRALIEARKYWREFNADNVKDW
eukprot:TRINITY_DN398_c0_g1_i3.p1 TRINITY_DN398_c0_g1~~TRINITY_DN398_c0_g1_i3.p1  ORF type:complete len:494 (+),score=62.19 TRINITY_DN398_c0_g1_i3:154-1635(+)